MVGILKDTVKNWSGELLEYVLVEGELPEFRIEFYRGQYDSKNYLREINAEIPVFGEHKDVSDPVWIVVPSLICSKDKNIQKEALGVLKRVASIARKNSRKNPMKQKTWSLSSKSKFRIVLGQVRNTKDLQKVLALMLVQGYLSQVFPSPSWEVIWPEALSRPDLVTLGVGPETANTITALAQDLCKGVAKFYAYDAQRHKILHLRTLEHVKNALDMNLRVLVASRVYYYDHSGSRASVKGEPIKGSLAKTVLNLLKRGNNYIYIGPMINATIKEYTAHVKAYVLEWGDHEILLGKDASESAPQHSDEIPQADYDTTPIERAFREVGLDFWEEVVRALNELNSNLREAFIKGKYEAYDFIKMGRLKLKLIAKVFATKEGPVLLLGLGEDKWFFKGHIQFTRYTKTGGGASISFVASDSKRTLGPMNFVVDEKNEKALLLAFPELKAVRALSM